MDASRVGWRRYGSIEAAEADRQRILDLWPGEQHLAIVTPCVVRRGEDVVLTARTLGPRVFHGLLAVAGLAAGVFLMVFGGYALAGLLLAPFAVCAYGVVQFFRLRSPAPLAVLDTSTDQLEFPAAGRVIARSSVLRVEARTAPATGPLAPKKACLGSLRLYMTLDHRPARLLISQREWDREDEFDRFARTLAEELGVHLDAGQALPEFAATTTGKKLLDEPEPR